MNKWLKQRKEKKAADKILCVEQWGDVFEMHTWHKHKCYFSITFSTKLSFMSCLTSALVIAAAEILLERFNDALQTILKLSEEWIVVDANLEEFTFSFGARFKFDLSGDGNLASDQTAVTTFRFKWCWVLIGARKHVKSPSSQPLPTST